MQLTRTLSILLLALAPLLLLGCEEDPIVEPTLDPPEFDVSGVWNMSETVNALDCGDGIDTNNYQVEVFQDGNRITVSTDVGDFRGTIEGRTVRWSGSFVEDGGTLTIESMTLTVQDGGQALRGEARWRWSNGSFSCRGTTQVTGSLASGN